MATKEDLAGWVMQAVLKNGGEAKIVAICKSVWDNHEQELKQSGDLFYTWGYDIRWAGQWLRDNDYLVPTGASKRGVGVATSKGKDHQWGNNAG
jgi:hypothetical protein